MASEAVYKFMKDQNRPYSLTEILQNVGKDLGRTAVQGALDKLVDKDKLFVKTYGKQKVYCIAQEATVESEMNEELKAINREITSLMTDVEKVEGNLRSGQTKLKERQQKITIEEAKVQKEKLETQIRELKHELEGFQESSKPISEAEKIKICEQYEKYVKEYKKRKALCKEIINQIMENYPKTQKKLLEDIGIETDEDVGFKFEAVLK